MAEQIKASNIPLTNMKAGTTIFRKVQTLRTSFVDPYGRAIDDPRLKGFNSSWSPSIAELTQISRHAPTADHRWSGVLPSGGAGIGGSYWGTMHGVMAEDFFYNIKNHLTAPHSDLIDRRFAPMVVHGRQRLEKYISDLPVTVPASGGNLSDILIGKLQRDLEVVDIHPTSEWARSWSEILSRDMKEPLNEFGYESLMQAVLDPNDRLFSRLVGNIAADRGKVGLVIPSVRADEMKPATSFNRDLANNLALLGPGGYSLADSVGLLAVLEIRPDAVDGAIAQVVPITSAYATETASATLVDSRGSPLRS